MSIYAESKRATSVPECLNPHNFQSIDDIVNKSNELFADKPAFTCMGRTLTYLELHQKSDAFAAYLQNETDLKLGDRVAVQLPNLIQSPVVIFGIIKAGMIVVNTNPLYTPKELQHQFIDSGAKALIVFANVAGNVEKIIRNVPELKHIIVTEIADFHPQPKRFFINNVVKYIKKMVSPCHSLNARKLNDVLAQGAAYPLSKVENKLSDVVALQYTGGTTGVAKGAMLTHANLLSNMGQMSPLFDGFNEKHNEIYIAPLPMYHIYAFVLHGLALFARGAHTILIPNPRNTSSLVKELSKWKFTGFVGLNTIFIALYRDKAFHKLDFSSLTTTLSGGMPLTYSVAEKWQQITNNKITEGYGLTETSPAVSFNPIGAQRIGTIGVPVKCTEVKLVDEEGETVVKGEPGILCVKGPQVMKGYWNNIEETEAVMMPDNYLVTGDIAIELEDNYLKIVDRMKDIIIVSGFKVYPAEIEDRLCIHPNILEAAVVGVADEFSGELVKAFVVVEDAKKMLDVDELRQFCKMELAAYKVPKYIEVRSELPKNNVGKVLRRLLKET